MTGEIHPTARTGFGLAAEAYERGRPAYPPDAVEWMAEALGIRPGTTVVDVGAGTGKLTRVLATLGVRPVAVDPVEAMLHELARMVPGVPAVGGRAEALPLRNGCADAVMVAQAFHWFDGEAALHEFHRVLRPGGGLGLLWNTRDESVPWTRALSDIIERHCGGTPGARTVDWGAAFEATRLFGPLERRTFRHEHPLPPSGVVDRVMSISFIAALPPPERAQVHEGVLELLRADPLTRGRETIPLPYRTDVDVTRAA
jgi:SAM-dependent methyltransferase